MTLQTEITQETIDTICQGIVVNDSWGQYVPQRLAQIISSDWPEALKAVQEQCPKDTLDVVLEGPEHADYWEAFDEILEIKITMDIGNGSTVYGLCAHGDVFLLDITALETLEGDGARLFWDAFTG